MASILGKVGCQQTPTLSPSTCVGLNNRGEEGGGGGGGGGGVGFEFV